MSKAAKSLHRVLPVAGLQAREADGCRGRTWEEARIISSVAAMRAAYSNADCFTLKGSTGWLWLAKAAGWVSVSSTCCCNRACCTRACWCCTSCCCCTGVSATKGAGPEAGGAKGWSTTE